MEEDLIQQSLDDHDACAQPRFTAHASCHWMPTCWTGRSDLCACSCFSARTSVCAVRYFPVEWGFQTP